MDVETMLRTTMAERASTMPAALAPYDSFIRRERAHRRTRRLRIAAATLSVAAVIGAGGAFALNRPPAEQSPAVEVDAPQDAAAAMDALLKSPLRGSLADDEAWVRQMRERVVTRITDELAPRPGTRVDEKGVKLLYAGDVAGQARVVVAYVPLLGKDSPKPMDAWYEGAPQADVSQMRPSSAGSLSEESQAVLAHVTTESDEDGWGLVVGPADSTVSATRSYELTAAGSVERSQPASGEPGSGVLEFVMPPGQHQPQVSVNVAYGGEVWATKDAEASWGSGPIDSSRYQEVITEALDGRKPGRKVPMSDWLIEAVDEARTSIDTAQVEIPWIGSLYGHPAVVFTVHEPGKGFLAFAYRATDEGYSSDYKVLMPAEGATDRPIAYRLYAGKGHKQTSDINVVAPPNTQRLELVVQDGQPQKLELDSSGRAQATVAPGQAATVTAYDGAGNEIGSTPLLPFRSWGPVGEAEGTRLVP